mgnify:CR=1 FL=1
MWRIHVAGHEAPALVEGDEALSRRIRGEAGDPEVVKTITEQAHRLMHGSDISNTRRSELAQRISQVMPDGLRDNCITYFTQSGSDAVESALKFAKRVTGRHQIIAFHGAYHGVWNGSALFGIKAFAVAILGGISNAWGVVAAGLIYGLAEALIIALLGSTYTNILGFSLVIVSLAIMPNGLFGTAGVRKV